MDSNLEKEEAIVAAKKALRDIEKWEDYKIERANFFSPDPPYHYPHWLVSFNFTEEDWYSGIVAPILIINDKTGRVQAVSYKKTVIKLDYQEGSDKYEVVV